MNGTALRVLLVAFGLGLASASSVAEAATLDFEGTFADAARPGSSQIFQDLAGGTYRGTYVIPDDSLPGTSGTALGLTSFRVDTLAAGSTPVVDFVSGRDFGALFFDFFGPGTGDGFVFATDRHGGLQFQVSVPTAFTGSAPIVGAALFGSSGGPSGQIDGATGIASVPLPLPATLTLMSTLSLLACGLTRAGSALRRADRDARSLPHPVTL